MRCVLGLLVICYPAGDSLAQHPTLELAAPVRRIWNDGNHNAFTDLIRYRDRWFCVFREGKGHAQGAGVIRVLESADGENWQSVATIAKNGVDYRDAHLSIAPDGRLMLNAAAAVPASRNPLTDHYSFVCFSNDGREWSEAKRILESWNWLWRVTWHKGVAYGVGYNWDPKIRGGKSYRSALYRSKNGIDYEKVADLQPEYASEATLQFDGDTLYCLQRRDKPGGINAILGSSKPPYTAWEWTDLGANIGGPNLLKDPHGNWWVTGRMTIRPQGPMTVVSLLDMKAAKLSEAYRLPSGGDNSYAGMVWFDNQLWVSYYSSHEGKSSIYLARFRVK